MYLWEKNRSLWAAFLIVILVSCTAGCTSKKEKVEGFISRGDALMEKGDPVRAILEYKNALQLDPQNAEVNFRLGRAFLAEKKYRNAFAAFKNSVRIDPDFDKARLEMASLLVSARAPEKALEQLEKVKHGDNFRPKLDILKAKALMLLKKYNDAIDILTKTDGKDREALILLTVCFKETGQISKMKDALEKWRRLDPKGPGSYLFMAQYLAEKGDKKGAALELEKMVKQRPSDAKLRLLQARLLERLGLTREALKIYNELPDEPAFMTAKADFYIRRGKSQQAVDMLQKLLEKEPENAEAAVKLSEALAVSGKNGRALEVLDKIGAKKLSKADNERVMMARAALYAGQGRLQDARRLCEKLLKENQGMMQAHLLLGKILLTMGELDKAEVHLNQAAVAQPANAEAQILLARCQLLNKKRSMAEDTLKNALKKNPTNVQLRMALVRYLVAQKDYSQALDLLEKGLNLSPKNALFLKTAGEIEALRKNYSKAETYFQRICKLEPQNALGFMEMGRLAATQGRYDKAVDWFLKACNTKNGWKLGVPALVETYLKKRDFDSALGLIQKEAVKRPESALIRYYLGRVLEAKGDAKGAETAYSKAAELAPKWPLPYQALAGLYLKQNKIHEAVSRMERLFEDSPSFSTGMNLAILYQYDNNTDKAIEVYKSLLKRYGKSPLLYNNLSYLYAQDSKDKTRLESARKMMAEVLAKHPKDSNFLDTAAWVEYKAGNLQGAWQYLQDAVNRSPDRGIIQLHCAVVANDLGYTEQAQRYLEKAMKHHLEPQARALALALKAKLK